MHIHGRCNLLHIMFVMLHEKDKKERWHQILGVSFVLSKPYTSTDKIPKII